MIQRTIHASQHRCCWYSSLTLIHFDWFVLVQTIPGEIFAFWEVQQWKEIGMMNLIQRLGTKSCKGAVNWFRVSRYVCFTLGFLSSYSILSFIDEMELVIRPTEVPKLLHKTFAKDLKCFSHLINVFLISCNDIWLGFDNTNVVKRLTSIVLHFPCLFMENL